MSICFMFQMIEAMDHITIQLSCYEAACAASALRFVAANLTLDGANGLRRFCNGDHFQCSIDELLSIDYVAQLLDDTRQDAVNHHSFNPFIKTF